MRALMRKLATLRVLAVLIMVCSVSCKTSSLLGVPGAVNLVTGNGVNSPLAAEQAFISARSNLFAALGGPEDLMNASELLSDEMTVGDAFTLGNVDARVTKAFTSSGNNFSEGGDAALTALLPARSALLVMVDPLMQYAPGDTLSQVGEAEALVGTRSS